MSGVVSLRIDIYAGRLLSCATDGPQWSCDVVDLGRTYRGAVRRLDGGVRVRRRAGAVARTSLAGGPDRCMVGGHRRLVGDHPSGPGSTRAHAALGVHGPGADTAAGDTGVACIRSSAGVGRRCPAGSSVCARTSRAVGRAAKPGFESGHRAAGRAHRLGGHLLQPSARRNARALRGRTTSCSSRSSVSAWLLRSASWATERSATVPLHLRRRWRSRSSSCFSTRSPASCYDCAPISSPPRTGAACTRDTGCSALTDQQHAGAALWFIAEFADLPFLLIVIRRWIRVDQLDAVRIDRELDERGCPDPTRG